MNAVKRQQLPGTSTLKADKQEMENTIGNMINISSDMIKTREIKIHNYNEQ